jgi:hypothetical protein
MTRFTETQEPTRLSAGRVTIRFMAKSSVHRRKLPGAIRWTADRGAISARPQKHTYVFGRGYQHDVVNETGSANGTDIGRCGVWRRRISPLSHADDLVVVISGDPAQAWIGSTSLASELISSVFGDSTVWDMAAIASAVIAGRRMHKPGLPPAMLSSSISRNTIARVNQGTDTVQAR